MFKILVAEDDAELQQLFCRVLTRNGFDALGVSDGAEALETLEHEYIDLIISDIMMPRMDGYALVRSLRDAGKNADEIADAVEGRGKTFTPVSITLEKGATVITGANMGGKSVALKTIALNILLIQCGFFPFASKASAPLFDSMYIISEDLENIDRGLSSFGGEMVRFNQVVRQLDGGLSFIMLDEFARGTNPDEGAAIVQAVTQYLNGQNAVTVLATHYDNVARHGCAHYQVIGLKDLNVEELQREIASRGGDVGVELISRHMNYGLYRVEGKQDCPRDALNICRLLGMNPDILAMVEKNYES